MNKAIVLNVHTISSKLEFAAVLWLTFILLPGSPLGAQTTAGTINGTVTDQSSSAVAGADLAVVNEETSATVHVETNASGAFAVAALPVGRYKVTVVKAGFQTYSEVGIYLEPSGVRTLNIALQVGLVTSSVTVDANLAQIETTTSETANQVGQRQAETLPLNGRNYQSLSALMPGVLNTQQGTALGSGGHGTSNAMSINGMGLNGTYYTIDGVWNMNTGNMTQTTIIPNPDTIEEVRVIQNNYSPKYSIMGASVVMLQTRSGTRDYHGNLFEYFRNTVLDSRNYFASTVPVEKQNIFGGTFGGPVTIPHFYNQDRTKSFFFFNAQFVRKDVGVVNTGSSPTAAMRAGLFPTSIKDPLTGLPFPENAAGQYVIPPSRINQGSLALLNALVPLPNNPTGGFNNYINLNPQTLSQNQYQVRGDQAVTNSEQVSGGFFQIHELELDPNHIGPYSTTTQYDPGTYRVAFLELTSTLSRSMVNQATLGMNMDVHDYDLRGIYLTSQVNGFSTDLPYNGLLSDRLPYITFTGGYSSIGTSSSYPEPHLADLEWTFADDWSMTRGNHQIELGFNSVKSTKRQDTFAYSQGQWSFDGYATGNPIADYLLGDAFTFAQVSTVRRLYIHAPIYAVYGQDRWRLGRKLTLNYGVRAQFMPLPNPTNNSLSMFLPSAYSAAQAPIVNANGTITLTPGYNAQNGLIRNGVNGIPQNYSTNHQWYWMPMAGFAYDIFGNGSTALRGGYGVTYERVFTGTDCTFYCGSNPPDVQSLSLQHPGFPNPIGTGTAPLGALTLSTQSPDLQAATVQSFSVNLDRQLSKSWIASAGLVGNHVTHLGRILNINQPMPVTGYNFNPAINTGTFAYQNSPYLGYASISDYVSNAEATWYGLATSLRHAFSHGFFLSASYTLSHGLSENRGSSIFAQGTGTQDVYHPNADYGDTNLDVRHVSGISYIWNIPGLRNPGLLTRTLLSGWSYVGMTSLRSGYALDPGLSVSNQGLATRPNLVAPITQAKLRKNWFSTASFAAPAPGFFGNAGTGIIRGPRLIDFDMALYKDFRVYEQQNLQFRAEAFNTFNHTNFNAVTTSLGSGTFGQVTSALDPRIMELSLRYQF
jgi:Carboxypeptidase regulatory-like domain/TonB-dependent Receptor Plug Domain